MSRDGLLQRAVVTVEISYRAVLWAIARVSCFYLLRYYQFTIGVICRGEGFPDPTWSGGTGADLLRPPNAKIILHSPLQIFRGSVPAKYKPNIINLFRVFSALNRLFPNRNKTGCIACFLIITLLPATGFCDVCRQRVGAEMAEMAPRHILSSRAHSDKIPTAIPMFWGQTF